MTFKVLMVGTGKSQAFCGAIRYEERCSSNSDHHREKIQYNCEDSTCPTCWPDWVEAESWNIAEYLLGCCDGWRARGVDLGDIIHVSNISLPDYGKPIYTRKEFNKYRNKLQDHLKHIGALGFALFIHPYRGSKKAREQYRKGLRKLPIAYHGHALAVFPRGVLETSSAFNLRTSQNPGLDTRQNRKTGAVYKTENLRSQTLVNLKKVVAYELDHCAIGVEPGHKNTMAVTYCGLFARNNFKLEEQLISEKPKLCLECGAEIHKYDGPEDLGPVMVREYIRIYKLRRSALDRAVARYGLRVDPGLARRDAQAELPRGEAA